MMNLKQFLKQPLRAVPNKVVVILLVVALLGFVDATYLTIEHYQNAIPPCSIGSCETVLTSSFSTVFGIPVAVGGIIDYLLICVGLFAYLESKNRMILRWTLLYTLIGFIVSAWFVFAQVVLIHAYCVYCMTSALVSTVLFVAGYSVLHIYRERELTIVE